MALSGQEVKTVWVNHRPHQNLQAPRDLASDLHKRPLIENTNVEANLDRGLRLHPEAKRLAISEGQ